MDVARETIVTARDQLRARLDRMFAQFFLEQLVRNPSAPQIRSASASSFGQGAFWRLKSIVRSVLKSIGCLSSSLILATRSSTRFW